ncbi:MAG: leucine-rich repeat domain-containing protein, partial [Clostridia bacterium]|nr:leucine-rich repeat domain-containing protein [Clostridia bacterium]
SVTIPDGVTSIGNSAFYHCTSLASVTIPDSVTSIGGYAFYLCSSLTSITIPDSVTSIGDETFDGCTSLTSITIPDSVTSIGNDVFRYCTSLTSVTIPDSVTSIGRRAFSNCTALTDVYYTGTPVEWEAIDITEGNDWLLNATIHFVSDSAYLTLHCPTNLYDVAFEAYGVANPGAEVSLYDGGTPLGGAQVDEAGNWRGSFKLHNPADPSDHTITATVTYGGSTVSQSKTLTYDKKTIYPTVFTLTHSGAKIDLPNVRNVNLTVVPSNPMDFAVKLNTNEDVQTVEILSVKGTEVKSISASFDSATGTWKASGWFDPANHAYVPGTLDLRLNGERLFMETAKINYLIDPSGYVYEAVRSNRVEGATASIFTKDGTDGKLWNANRYEQDNPQTTDAFGVYHWDVTEGTWRVKVEKDGYQTAYSDWMDVPPEWKEVAVPLVTTQAPQVADVTAEDETITMTFSQYMDINSVSADNVTVQCGGTNIPVTVTPVNAEVSGTDSAVSYASVFRVQPQTTLAGKADIRIANVRNYAGIAIAQDVTCTVQFKETGKVRSVSIPDLTVQYKSSGKLAPNVAADEGVQYTLAYSGFDSGIISVDKNGSVTTRKAGTTTVTVTATDEYGNKAEAKCTVTVKYAWWQMLIRIFLFGWLWY